ncbi:hypothetical protein T01_3035 [Trichinella spiralis]|uniref:Uncharacterized protein n=1 Tax=Trichinella spiralis TaxID=6334 RepID=A0A0V1BLV5_TRISP|nr:hypothetical protein T01_3035 [Trichinella spiralis]
MATNNDTESKQKQCKKAHVHRYVDSREIETHENWRIYKTMPKEQARAYYCFVLVIVEKLK